MPGLGGKQTFANEDEWQLPADAAIHLSAVEAAKADVPHRLPTCLVSSTVAALAPALTLFWGWIGGQWSDEYAIGEKGHRSGGEVGRCIPSLSISCLALVIAQARTPGSPCGISGEASG